MSNVIDVLYVQGAKCRQKNLGVVRPTILNPPRVRFSLDLSQHHQIVSNH